MVMVMAQKTTKMTLLAGVLSALLALSLPITTTARQPPSNYDLTFPASFEMDLLFPQNTTYKPPPSDIFPVVFAIQNVSSIYRAISAMERARNFPPGHLSPYISWHVDVYADDGRVPAYVALQIGMINLTDPTYRPPPEKGDDFAIYTDIFNLTAVLETGYGDLNAAQLEFRYVIAYNVKIAGEYLSASDENGKKSEICPGSFWTTPGLGRITVFNIDRPQLEDYLPPDQLAEAKKSLPVDVMESIPECPELVSFVDILPNITDLETGGMDQECPVYFDGYERESGQANPCAVKVDGEILSTVSSEVSRSAMPPTTTTATTDGVATSTSTGAAGLMTPWGAVRPMQTALVAACVLCGLAL